MSLFLSYGETSGFAELGADELSHVNGGKGGSSSSKPSMTPTIEPPNSNASGISGIFGVQDGFNLKPNGVTIKDGNTQIDAKITGIHFGSGIPTPSGTVTVSRSK